MCFAYLFACCCCSFLPETEEVQRQKGLTCPFFTDVPVTINLSSGLNRHEVLRNKKKKVDFTKSPKFADSWGLLHQFINWEKFTNERKKWSSIAMVFFSSPHFLIGLVNSRHTLEQPEAKQKKIPSCLQVISRVWGSPSCHRRPLMLTLVMFG